MAQNGEIIVNESALDGDIQKLAALETALKNRNLDIKFTTAKGATADGLLDAAAELKAIGETLRMLVGQTKIVMEQAKTSFSEADQLAKQTMDSIS